ncbi:MAG: COQ9 family protein [Boseongicola sp.]|nr:COQ9 family protein [Boseongicola sp.]NNJ67259.1 COQ9 family protein [Boseongicola sp.]
MRDTIRDQMLDAILAHVPFDGWSDTAFRAAIVDSGIEKAVAETACPRGAMDLAIAYHRRGDAAMVAAMKASDMSEMRFRDKVATALKLRVEALDDREAVRRASAFFALPQNAAEGAKLIWETADKVWTTLGDTSRDVNWYTKRATLSGVWASTVLFWLGDESPLSTDTMDFIDRRIDNVMQIEKAKASLKKNPLTKPFMSLKDQILSNVKAPDKSKFANLPGNWNRPT